MGDKAKGKQTGNAKKVKKPKVGLRPHEVRERETLKSPVPTPATHG